ncbi:unnamed protein product [Sphenostylis stenocarpa]|uniref:C3HC-type domain-containing protein n=1 Tax=Sphenostylis stenocarpa TaxID=92480 RepID=A0AA86VFY9_9FABA|nr:unnamed protein product [Sphenostylis stenocarpa]
MREEVISSGGTVDPTPAASYALAYYELASLDMAGFKEEIVPSGFSTLIPLGISQSGLNYLRHPSLGMEVGGKGAVLITPSLSCHDTILCVEAEAKTKPISAGASSPAVPMNVGSIDGSSHGQVSKAASISCIGSQAPWTSLSTSAGASSRCCRPWERGDLLRRLATFIPSNWLGKPQIISSLACAQKGWINNGVDKIACESCGTCLSSTALPSLTSAEEFSSVCYRDRVLFFEMWRPGLVSISSVIPPLFLIPV